MSDLGKMIALAATRHEGQYDKGGNPYILHPLKVMHYTRSEDPEIQMIAVGHDLVEDTDVTLEYLESLGFSDRVIDGIDAVSRREWMENGKLVLEDKHVYRERVKKNRDAIIVKMADLRHNTDVRRLKGLTEKDFKRMEDYQKFYAELKEIRLQQGF